MAHSHLWKPSAVGLLILSTLFMFHSLLIYSPNYSIGLKTPMSATDQAATNTSLLELKDVVTRLTDSLAFKMDIEWRKEVASRLTDSLALKAHTEGLEKVVMRLTENLEEVMKLSALNASRSQSGFKSLRRQMPDESSKNRPALGFIIIRHVNSNASDHFWKECYNCIRKFYDNPILIIDDSSNRAFLTENLRLVNAQVVYDTTHKGAAEFLSYFYFHQLRPFDSAVVLMDSVFLQSRLNISAEPVQFLWTFEHAYDVWAQPAYDINGMIVKLPHGKELVALHGQIQNWKACFGTMSIIQWEALDRMNQKYRLWDFILPKVGSRPDRMAMERVLGILTCHFFGRQAMATVFGDIFAYYNSHHQTAFNVGWLDYVNNPKLKSMPAVKIWSGR
jgi:hypothetical protein